MMGVHQPDTVSVGPNFETVGRWDLGTGGREIWLQASDPGSGPINARVVLATNGQATNVLCGARVNPR